MPNYENLTGRYEYHNNNDGLTRVIDLHVTENGKITGSYTGYIQGKMSHYTSTGEVREAVENAGAYHFYLSGFATTESPYRAPPRKLSSCLSINGTAGTSSTPNPIPVIDCACSWSIDTEGFGETTGSWSGVVFQRKDPA